MCDTVKLFGNGEAILPFFTWLVLSNMLTVQIIYLLITFETYSDFLTYLATKCSILAIIITTCQSNRYAACIDTNLFKQLDPLQLNFTEVKIIKCIHKYCCCCIIKGEQLQITKQEKK